MAAAAADALPPCRLVVLDAEGKRTTATLDFTDISGFWNKLLPAGKAATLYIPRLQALDADREFAVVDELVVTKETTLAVHLVPSLSGARASFCGSVC